MTPCRLTLCAALAMTLGSVLPVSADMVRARPSAAIPDRARAETEFRRIDGAVKQTLRSCASARSDRERCSCQGQLKIRRAEIERGTQDTSDIMAALFAVMKESTKQQAEDKKYYLEKLKEYNKMTKEIREYQAKTQDYANQHCKAGGLAKRPFGGLGAGRRSNPGSPGGTARPAPIRPLAEQNTDRPGADYHSFDLSGADSAPCRAACARDARCKAWTFMKPGIRGPRAHCWLKSRIPPPRRNACCVSGVK